MTPRDSSQPLRSALERLHADHVRARALAASVRAAAGVAGLVTLALLLGPWLVRGEAAAWVRLSIVALGILAALGWAVRRFRASVPRFDALLEDLEHRFPDLRSWLRNALDFERTPPAHVSGELAQAVSAETARRLAGVPIATTVPGVRPGRPLAALLGALAAVVVMMVAAPQRALDSWASLLDPGRAAPPVRLEVEPGSVRVTPGAALTVRARVWGTTRRPQLERPGEPALAAAAEGVGDGGARLWRFDLAQLTREQTYRVRAARALSPAYRIALAGEPSAVSFEIEYHPPAYAHLPVERGAATRGDLSALRGTRARIVATFDRDLAGVEARLPGGGGAAWTEVTPRRWSGEVPILGDGEYQLTARAGSGTARMSYRMTALPDAPPVLVVQRPTGDTDLPAGQQVPLEILAQDDLGLAHLSLQYKKDADAPWQVKPLAEFAARPREAAVRTAWDASSLGLLPGQTATFRFELVDDDAIAPGRTLSQTFQLRFPGLSELYDSIDHQQSDVHQALEKAADQAKEVQKSLDQMARQQQAQAMQPSSNAFEKSEQMKSSLQQQQDLSHKIDQASQDLRQTIEQAAERQAFNEDLMRKLHEMSDLVQQVQSAQFREALKKMQDALDKMDPQAMQQNLPEWQKQNRDMMAQLQRTIDLLKQLRQEEQLDALAQRAQDLKAQQDALNQQHGQSAKPQSAKPQDGAKSSTPKTPDPQKLAEQQSEAAKKSDQLGQDAKQLGQQSPSQQDQQQLDQASHELQDGAAPQQKQAAESAQQHQGQQAQQHGQQASESLQQAADQLKQMAQSAQSRRQQLDLASVRRAAKDLVSLQREAESNLANPAPNAERGDRQSDLSDGVARVADSLFVLAHTQPFITPRLSESLGRAIQSLSESGRQLTTGNPARGEQQGHDGSTALNQAILELRLSESRMCNNPNNSGNGQKSGGKAGEMLSQMGEQQSQINQETRDVAQRLSQQMRLSAGDQAELRRLADAQHRLSEQLDQIQKDEELKKQLLGRLDQAQSEMKQVEEELSRGNTDGELQQQQQRILSRLLDAQRSVNRRDFDPQRESRPGQDVARASAPEIPADLMRETDRLRLDLLKAESDRYPAQYRAYIEAYLRSLNEQRATPAR